MPVQLFLAPAGFGKSEYVLKAVQEAARGLQDTPRVVLPTPLQVHAWQRRLAAQGGALGVRLLTFDNLYKTVLNGAQESYTLLEDPVEYRLLRAVVDELTLPHYGALGNRPGFIQVMRAFIGELKGAQIWPDDYLASVGDEARLRELGMIYSQYQERLQAQKWADHPGLGWLAVEALRERSPQVAGDWSLLVVDGFDSFTETQLALLALLAGRVEQMVITLTGEAAPGEAHPRPVYGRFERTRRQLEAALGVRAQPLPGASPPASAMLARLERNLFERGEQGARLGDGGDTQVLTEEREENPEDPPDQHPIRLLAAPDRAGEVREALRWLKERLVLDGAEAADLALLARDLTPYRSDILQTAAEFGLPLRLVDGLPLRQNPAIAALLALLRLVLPAGEGDSGPALPRRGVIAAWRSPYFEWTTAYAADDDEEPIGIGPGDAEMLDAVARWGRVIGGFDQWGEVLHALRAQGEGGREADDEERGRPANIPGGVEAATLEGKFVRFFRRLLQLVQGDAPYREHVVRLERLIGPDPNDGEMEGAASTAPIHLNMIGCVDDGDAESAGRDRAALQTLKDVLRGLVWAEDVVGDGAALSFARFFEELAGAVEAAIYHPPRPTHAGILVANVIAARGIPFQAVAVLGMAEGEFPAALREDPFLRDADRKRLREEYGLRLEPSTESRERETFYETVTRPWEKLLLTRPRLAESGAPWQASPYWQEVTRRSGAGEERVSSERVPQPETAASWPELLAGLVAHAEEGAAATWVEARAGGRWQKLAETGRIFRQRYEAQRGTAYDGDLSALQEVLAEQYGPAHTWSPSRLESYRTCPLFFFAGNVLGLEPRPEPAEGLDARQLGNLYHRILEAVYQAVPVEARTDAEALKEALPGVAERIMDTAPVEEGFRATAWWEQTRAEIEEKVARSLEALSALDDGFVPVEFEAGFFGRQALTVRRDGDSFRLHGLIDRVDRAPDGRIRIVDYKTAGPAKFGPPALEKGEKLQLPLYARAASETLELGEVADGFYWHVQHGEASRLKLATYGVEAAIERASAYAWEVVQRVRQGDFVPSPPAGGCPDYCPAATFCWQYEARRSW